ncbi:MAG: hypothetical protein LBF16_06770 [Pseudomonadales bacterium]|nr:hypothetical protein [Pseudomonadales bacterium]
MTAAQFASCAFAANQDVQCPSTIPAESVHIADGEEGWIAYVLYPLKLTSAGFMQGEPSTRAHLKPWATREIAGGDVATWVFEGLYSQGKWLSCEYAGGVASLSRRIADTTSECSITYEDGEKNAQIIREIICK